MLSLFAVAVVPARAGSLHVNDVAQVITTSSNGGAQLRLRAVSQSGSNLVNAPRPANGQDPQGTQSNGTNSTSVTDNTSSVAVAQDPSAPNIETIELGDVTGTVCDCGELLGPVLPGGGFPLYPLFALGALPLAFLDFGGDEEQFDIPPGPPPPPTNPIPEPATLLLLGSGLAGVAAKVRRRRRGEQSSEIEARNVAVNVGA